jgi:hypothetical protein
MSQDETNHTQVDFDADEFNTSGEFDEVWIFDEQCWGYVIKPGAHLSLVRYSKGGIVYTEWMDNTNLMAKERLNDD